jgi:hypothetical protein
MLVVQWKGAISLLSPDASGPAPPRPARSSKNERIEDEDDTENEFSRSRKPERL